MKRISIAVILLLALSLLMMAGCDGKSTSSKAGVDTITFFMGHALKDYPAEGTIVGDYIEEQTGVKATFEFLVGELEQKVGIMIASGEYPDVVNGRNFHQKFIDAGVLIPLEDLIDEYGPNIKKLYGSNYNKLIREDGHIYLLPAFVPTEEVYKTTPDQGFYIQKRVLKEFGYPTITTVDEYFDLIRKFAAKYPETKGKSTLGFTSLFYSWRNYAVMNAPSCVTGHPNDGSGNVDLINGKWTVSSHYDTPEAKEIYSKYNEMYLEGLFDPESFVADYDQYKAKLASGRILGFLDQNWSVQEVQDLLIKDDEDMWYVALPIVLDGFESQYNGPLALQVDQGVSITTSCKDPVAVIKYFDFLCKEETQKIIGWGFEGTDYLVDDEGHFYRTPEMRARLDQTDYDVETQGNKYFNYMMPGYGETSLFSDGNVFSPKKQPYEFFAKLKDSEKEVLGAYGFKTWNDFFNPPDNRRADYYPLWTGKMETGSPEEIASQKVNDIRNKYVPLLIMAEKGTYDAVWDEMISELNKVDNLDSIMKFYQDLVDTRVAAWSN